MTFRVQMRTKVVMKTFKVKARRKIMKMMMMMMMRIMRRRMKMR